MQATKALWNTLLDKDADVNAQGGEYGSAHQAASVAGHKEFAKLLLAQGAFNAHAGESRLF